MTAIAILLLSLDDGYERDLALNVPVIYMLMNIGLVLLFGITLRRTGWLEMDEEDETMTMGKVMRKWRQKKQGNGGDEDAAIEMKEEGDGALPLPGQCLLERTFDLEEDLVALQERYI